MTHRRTYHIYSMRLFDMNFYACGHSIWASRPKTFWTTIESDNNNNNYNDNNNNDTLLSTFTMPWLIVCCVVCKEIKPSKWDHCIVLDDGDYMQQIFRIAHAKIPSTHTDFTWYASTFNVNCDVILTRCRDLTFNNVSILSLLTIDPALSSAQFPKSN